MNVALVGSVDFNEEHFAAQRFDAVYAVDGGWETCVAAGICPSMAIGDFDSLGYVPEGVALKRFASVKDESDMELAFASALEEGATSVSVYGGLSRRLDHTLANMLVMCAYAQKGLKVCGIGDDFAVVALAARTEARKPAPSVVDFAAIDPDALGGSYAPYLSVMALGGSVGGLTIRGLAYEVDRFALRAETSRGLSNRFVGTSASISIDEGSAVVICPLDAFAIAKVALR